MLTRGLSVDEEPRCYGTEGKNRRIRKERRVNNSPTTLQAKTGAEPRSDALGENASVDTRNPDVRLPVKIPAEGRAEKPEEKNTAGDRNPDIRVPERFKRKEGLRVRDKEGEEDAEERDAEKAEHVDNGGNKEEDDPDLGERRPFDSRGDTTRGLDSPTKPDLRHVPGGTWLQQKPLSVTRDPEEEEHRGDQQPERL
ncbi:hypothetical protein NDU88_001622 [Pleurodeles waltl]|uniref:Uncharacterized protein n=1 Tax=Pleurodeles waltl TaxID=8319 RepID=A0AAV7L159_PLEWA|nr:hypothetical protein NDU88_001622 [Pleurodeles waltl]